MSNCPFSSLAPYSTVFGKPNEGVHAVRFLGLALVDVVFTVVFAWWIDRQCSTGFFKTLVFLIILGETLHFVFCVPTAVCVKLIRTFSVGVNDSVFS